VSDHNHVTRDIKPRGTCPACDEYHTLEVVRAIEAELDDADQIVDSLERPNYIAVWGVRRVLMRFGGKPHRWPVPAEFCDECEHLSWNHYTTEQSLDGCAECDCLLSRREAHWGRDEELDDTITQAVWEDAVAAGEPWALADSPTHPAPTSTGTGTDEETA
jgi:hypothetical protein